MDYTVHTDTWLSIASIGNVREGTLLSVTDRDDCVHTGAVSNIVNSNGIILVVLNTGYVFGLDNAKYLRVL